ncbi:MAG: helix-turn-helix transcriptional regulator [Clostridia bacterium]|nr:helix-turn-helix transcriptional regulator [Clostridia bacterium]
MGWTQKDVAERLHVSVAAVSKWERGLNYPDLSLVEPLAQLLVISPAELLGLENEPVDGVIRQMTALSATEEKRLMRKRRIQILSALGAIGCLALCSCFFLFLTAQETKLSLRSSLGYDLLAIGLGLAAWGVGIASIFCRKERQMACSLFSFASCAVSLWIPLWMTSYALRVEDWISIQDTIGGYCFGGSVLVAGTVLFCLVAVLLRRRYRT